ncbi:hypothetical protein BEP19_11805 [Ammoniphilus oxalaticus]|uniref:Copper amine oxidase-like N-terminal domain-containing protein n=1 Tax=Ammoniphilus oxalaticus TaxID=66863 RepID=A0A419SGJ5_9BACL|nr:copper amine oxidase N-terminal domain-containing protein [Ammoniphilus oxalaticus]RKD22914.1 hypothetical protein BEP19_11805 [Ammoniphilus oxalaticus]
MKKYSVLTTAALTITILSGNIALASSPATPIQIDNQIEASDYMKASGIISEVGQKGDLLQLFLNDMENDPAYLLISDKTLILDSATGNRVDESELKKELTVDAYYDKNKPMIMIYPPQIAPEIVIVHGEEMGQVKVGKFTNEFVSLDNQLKLNLAEDTQLVNHQGKEIKEDELNGKELIVFYTASTKSIPAQTTPNKIIALDPLNEEIDEVIEPEMVPLREVAEGLGYDVEWDESTKRVTLTKQASSYQLTIGAKDYGYNRSLGYLDVAPEIKDGRTYVPQQFVDLLLENQS